MRTRLAVLVILMAMKDLVFGVLATAARWPAQMRSASVTFVAVALAFLATHVFRTFLATRVATAATVMIGSTMIIMGLRKATHREHRAQSNCQQNGSSIPRKYSFHKENVIQKNYTKQ